MHRFLVLLLSVPLAACAHHAPGAPLPPCLEVRVDGDPSGTQEFRFDAQGRLLEQVQILDEREGKMLTTDYEWTTMGMLVLSGDGDIKSENRFGPHGELVERTDKLERCKLNWEGIFSPASPWPFFESLYIGTSPALLLPRFTAERTVVQHMAPFVFSGQVTVKCSGELLDKPFELTRAIYLEGRLLSVKGPHYQMEATWSPQGALEREVYRESSTKQFPSKKKGGVLEEVTYRTTGGHLLASVLRRDGKISRDMTYVWGRDGQVSKVEGLLHNGETSERQTTVVRACEHPAPRGKAFKSFQP